MNLKRIFAGVAAAATMLGGLAIGATSANAADSANTITITGDVSGRTFTAYPLGTYVNEVLTGDEVTSVDFNQATWTSPSIAEAATTAISPDTIPDAYKGNVLAYMTTLNETTDGAKLRRFAEELSKATGKPDAAATATGKDGAALLENLTPGYYLIIDSAGAPILVGTAIEHDGKVYDQFNGQTLGVAYAKPTEPSKPGKTVSGDINGTVTQGDVLGYVITSVIPGTAGNDPFTYKIKDVASKGLDMPTDKSGFGVTINGEPYADFTVTSSTNANGETETIIDLGDVKGKDGQTVQVTYNATVNEQAVNEYTNTASVAPQHH
ncbi:isopeptide-forming domain-containing fimbrial protein [Bifidobacterium cuniculi]|uniref:Fimbrial subunit n=1 Tax=Bifidobacterium cuniculi TaxID=1688 RepID=A0A087AIH2_9BIFI|nr:isopeptide-forming domain-containing fimbrial protein [Bifidobacterium cuniculi]KFI58572.1 fimbrial subunit [Bifidobacterium cuniculi]